jgi:hypothetical protein
MLNKISINFNFWFYAMVFSLIVYILIKFLEKKTKAEPGTAGAKLFTMDSISPDAN